MSNNNQHIPPGYKPSPLGIIPEDWEVKRLRDVCTFHNGRAYSQKELLSSGKYRVLRVGNFFTNGSWYWSDMELEDDKYANNGDLLYAWSASFGPKFWEGEKVIYHYHIWKIDSFNEVSKDFLYSFLLYDATKLTNTLQGGTMTHITKENMEKRNIAVPPIHEQQRIVSVLSLWDTAIAKQTALIEQLTLRKRGLMQQLLTGKKRLKGFEGNSFKMMSFDKIANTINVKAFQISKSDYQEKGKTPIVDQGQMFIAAYSDSDKIFTNVPFILFGDHTRIIKWIDFPCIIGADGVQAIKPKEEIDIKYLYYLLSNTELPNLGYSRHMSILKEKVFYVSTDIDEQKAIAGCLSNADKEIEIQKQKLAALQEQKKGLMQVLLTGKKRIK